MSARGYCEKLIAKKLVQELCSNSWLISVDNGEDDDSPKSNSPKIVLSRMFKTDQDLLFLYKNGEPVHFSWVKLVYGNDAYDLISDYTTNLEGKWPLTEKLCREIEEA